MRAATHATDSKREECDRLSLPRPIVTLSAVLQLNRMRVAQRYSLSFVALHHWRILLQCTLRQQSRLILDTDTRALCCAGLVANRITLADRTSRNGQNAQIEILVGKSDVGCSLETHLRIPSLEHAFLASGDARIDLCSRRLQRTGSAVAARAPRTAQLPPGPRRRRWGRQTYPHPRRGIELRRIAGEPYIRVNS